MDENELKSILRKHRTRGTWFFIFSAIVLMSIHFYYGNREAISTMSYSIGLLVIGLGIVFSFVEKVLLDILKQLSIRE